MDPMDEFQFKPLTEGLGFHKRNEQSPEPKNLKASSAQFKLDNTSSADISSPLPRKTTRTEKIQPLNNPNSSVDDILKTLNQKRKVDFAENTPTRQSLREKTPDVYVQSYWDFSASLLDMMLVIAANLACLIVLLLVTQVDLFSNIINPDANYMIYFSLAALFLGISWIYSVCHRAFLGFTPGEWVFDQRLGTPDQMHKGHYALKAIARSSLILITGFITLPLLSALMKRDLVGQWLGVTLVRKH
ncbi:MAG: metalloendopeptidase [Pseudobdellovibrionaceae bacterium]